MTRADLGPMALLLGLSGAGCGATPVAERSPSESERVKPVCLVLSVGADKGLAHIGVIHALHEHGVKADCVIGTSMGSLIGGLYAYAPNEDPAIGYRQVFKNYTRIKEDEAGGSGLVGFLIGGALVAATGGTGVALALGSASGTVLGASSVQIKDWNTLHQSLTEHFGGARIESLKVPFITQYRVPEAPDAETVTGGKLADEIATSVKNPLLFPHLRVDAKSELDPGLDQLSAVPLNLACEKFPNHQLIVSNVTGAPGKVLRETTCPMQEIMIDVPSYNGERAIRGQDPELSTLIQAGFSSAMATLDWERLPRAGKVPQASLSPVEVYVNVVTNSRKPDGRPWDIDGSAPDVELGFVVGDVHEAYGTSIGSFYNAKGAVDQGVLRANLGLMRLRHGQRLGVHLIDDDLGGDDPIGSGSAVFTGQGAARIRTEGATVEIEFKSAESK